MPKIQLRKRSRYACFVWAPVALCSGLACSGNNDNDSSQSAGGMASGGTKASGGSFSRGGSSASGGTSSRGGSSSGGTGGIDRAKPTTFIVTLENISEGSLLPSAFNDPLVFTQPKQVLGEDAKADTPGFAESLFGGSSSEFEKELLGRGAQEPIYVDYVPIAETSEFEFSARPGERLVLFSEYMKTEDLFVGFPLAGVELFEGGVPRSGDLTNELVLFDAGSRKNRGPRASEAENDHVAESEAVITHAEPDGCNMAPALSFVAIDVKEVAGSFDITLSNISQNRALSSALSPVFYATHNAGWRLYARQAQARPELEQLAEEGDPDALVTVASASTDVGTAGRSELRIDLGAKTTFSVTPSADHPRLTFALMVLETNSTFIATPSEGIALLDDAGAKRAAEDVARDLRRSLDVYDAGTEDAEIPGLGNNQPLRTPNSGSSRDADVDLALGNACDWDRGRISLNVVHQKDFEFNVTLVNDYEASLPRKLSAPVWLVHDETFNAFAVGKAASPGLAALAEHGDGSLLVQELVKLDSVKAAGVHGDSLIERNGVVTFQVTADGSHRFLTVLGGLTLTNDTFFAVNAAELVDAGGTPRASREYGAITFDAGVEANQLLGTGSYMFGIQTKPNTGVPEGNGKFRLLDDQMWSYPAPHDLLRVTLRPKN